MVGISDIDKINRNEIQKKFNIPCYEDFKELLENISAEVIVVATPENTHSSILREILNFNPKLVFCEKPLATTLGEVKALAKAYEKINTALIINYNRHFLKEYCQIKQSLLAGELGTIQSVLFYYSRGFLRNASHNLDLVLWWFGEPDDFIIEGQRKGITENDPTLSLLLKYSSGTEIRLVGLESSNVLINEVDIIGTNGRIQIDTMGRIVFSKVDKHPNYNMFKGYFKGKEKKIDLSIALPNAVNTIYQWLMGEAKLPTPARDSIALHKLIQKIIGRFRD